MDNRARKLTVGLLLAASQFLAAFAAIGVVVSLRNNSAGWMAAALVAAALVVTTVVSAVVLDT